jgi:HPr kinase/phosphorylase
MNPPATTRDLYNSLKDRLGLEWIAGREGSERQLLGEFPGAGSQGLVGPLNYIHPNRIQIIGRAELVYFSGIDPDFYQDTISKLFFAQPAAIILADEIEIDEEFERQAESHQTPLLRSRVGDNQLLGYLQHYLTHALAECTTVHGVFMDVIGVGILLTGAAAIGKSELALELVSRGHRLIADDSPEFSRIAPDTLNGTCPPLLQDFLEVRGLGLINIRAMFGDSAIKQTSNLQLVINLVQMSDLELQQIDRLEGSRSTRSILGLDIPQVTLPVAAGREMAILVETATRQHILRSKGYDAAADFMQRQQQEIIDRSENE